ncbi:hypothetical protein CAOG_009990 [Capsaspora owczarzaki ATCC 30864]|uniref:Uncharacterized protein n=1 Tax=Capsaspora owczarzaki (strain ATCC 30864) TaxID=595528 RepID=A0A0D2VWW2_CAPO3|nr:hypothetical protein CAOG_009990 [Capsaspora owczarzaki ATCC 30864]
MKTTKSNRNQKEKNTRHPHLCACSLWLAAHQRLVHNVSIGLVCDSGVCSEVRQVECVHGIVKLFLSRVLCSQRHPVQRPKHARVAQCSIDCGLSHRVKLWQNVVNLSSDRAVVDGRAKVQRKRLGVELAVDHRSGKAERKQSCHASPVDGSVRDAREGRL